jgi:hypothetical protein
LAIKFEQHKEYLTMIHHISIAANQPLQVAEILAEILQGQAIPFPAHQDSYVALAIDEQGTMIEVLPQGTELTPDGFNQVSFDRSHGSPFHAAISVAISELQVYQIVQRTDWHIQTCDRQGLFHVIEVWIDNQQLLEILPPNFTAEYLAATSPEALMQYMPTSISN